MAIIGTLPNNIQNGQLEDATPLMADFNFIVNQVNANANPIGTLTAPAGTRVLFNQPAPPVGWTQEVGAAFSDTSVRTVTGAGGGTGGAAGWSAWNFGSTFNLNAFTISVAQLPAHTHTGSGITGISDQSLNHTHNTNAGGLGGFQAGATGAPLFASTASSAVDLSNHTHHFSFTSDSTGSGSAITPTITTPLVKYSDYVIGIKS